MSNLVPQRANDWIRLSTTEHGMQTAKIKWATKFTFPTAIGAIACTHVEIEKPRCSATSASIGKPIRVLISKQIVTKLMDYDHKCKIAKYMMPQFEELLKSELLCWRLGMPYCWEAVDAASCHASRHLFPTQLTMFRKHSVEFSKRSMWRPFGFRFEKVEKMTQNFREVTKNCKKVIKNQLKIDHIFESKIL